ncbi:VC0807 family protein [Cerasicoccus arenae]|uniref:MFS transporter n=1 Tax=Cerasicoccus arenae TaxID=424488 RepID=A0A8J3D8G3_9BACT|nr:VC0807 family protein [Cerasicoccus arenae]MBK1857469.1 hypothetical protein [Cerasicoccus arenae]GHB95207.1 hypothetical protein GCM10007047_08590 [Cerasicoccus arenae]
MSQPPRENLFLNLGFNLLLPVMILNKGAKWLPFLSPTSVLLVALAFPVGYFLYDLKKRKKRNLISILGIVGVLLTGSIGLFKLPPIYFAIKETLMPLLIGIAVVVSLKTKNPLIHALLYNPDIFDAEKIDARIDTPAKKASFNDLMKLCTWIIALSFLVSAFLNFFITKMIVVTDPRVDQAAYNSEIGTQHWVGLIVISICTLPISFYAMWRLFKGIEQLTGLTMEEVIHADAKKDSKDKT